MTPDAGSKLGIHPMTQTGSTESGRTWGLRRPRPVRVLVMMIALSGAVVMWYIVVPLRRATWLMTEVSQRGGYNSRVVFELGGPDWLRKLIGDEWMYGFDEVRSLRVSAPPGLDTVTLFQYLGRYETLESISWSGERNCEEEFARLQCLPNLKRLHLRGPILSDEG
ncbi:MAG: hypothetical protein DWQ29_19975, partial [Planctomycetota bacterium]